MDLSGLDLTGAVSMWWFCKWLFSSLGGDSPTVHEINVTVKHEYPEEDE